MGYFSTPLTAMEEFLALFWFPRKLVSGGPRGMADTRFLTFMFFVFFS